MTQAIKYEIYIHWRLAKPPPPSQRTNDISNVVNDFIPNHLEFDNDKLIQIRDFYSKSISYLNLWINKEVYILANDEHTTTYLDKYLNHKSDHYKLHYLLERRLWIRSTIVKIDQKQKTLTVRPIPLSFHELPSSHAKINAYFYKKTPKVITLSYEKETYRSEMITPI